MFKQSDRKLQIPVCHDPIIRSGTLDLKKGIFPCKAAVRIAI